MKKKNNWFVDTFLKSFEDSGKFNNPKYPGQAIISDKQMEICYKYMEPHQYKEMDYKIYFTILELRVNNKLYTAQRRGKYNFLNVYDE